MGERRAAVRSFWCDNEPVTVQVSPEATFADVCSELAASANQDVLDVEGMFNDLAKWILANANRGEDGI